MNREARQEELVIDGSAKEGKRRIGYFRVNGDIWKCFFTVVEG